MTEKISIETFDFGEKETDRVKNSSVLGDMVEVCITRPYGNLTIRVDAERITIEAQNGDGETVSTHHRPARLGSPAHRQGDP